MRWWCYSCTYSPAFFFKPASVKTELILIFDSVTRKCVLLWAGQWPVSSWTFGGIQVHEWCQEQELGSDYRTLEWLTRYLCPVTIEKWLGCSIHETRAVMLAACLTQGWGETRLTKWQRSPEHGHHMGGGGSIFTEPEDNGGSNLTQNQRRSLNPATPAWMEGILYTLEKMEWSQLTSFVFLDTIFLLSQVTHGLRRKVVAMTFSNIFWYPLSCSLGHTVLLIL